MDKQRIQNSLSNIQKELAAIAEELGEAPANPYGTAYVQPEATGGYEQTSRHMKSRVAFSGLTDDEYAILHIFAEYYYESRPVEEEPSQWEVDFCKDWISKDNISWNTSGRQADVLHKIKMKLVGNDPLPKLGGSTTPPEPEKKEEDYFDDDIPF